jgi:hypothetical protein
MDTIDGGGRSMIYEIKSRGPQFSPQQNHWTTYVKRLQTRNVFGTYLVSLKEKVTNVASLKKDTYVSTLNEYQLNLNLS